MKIERNSLCPCLSGAKYKNCCYRHPERSEVGQIINAKYVDKDHIFSDLKNRSSVMSRFLNSVPDDIIQPMWLFTNPNLNANMRTLVYDNHFIIIIKQVPIAEEDYFDFAHEIGHIILSMKGYPMCSVASPESNMMSLATILINTIMDPLVNRLVTQYGFDWDAYIDKSFRIQLPIIKSYSHSSVFDRHFLRCLCIEKILEWRILNISIPNQFIPMFQKYHPKEYDYALSFSNDIEFSLLDNTQYVRALLLRLINDNQMQDILKLL